jgi:hypothetical protein
LVFIVDGYLMDGVVVRLRNVNNHCYDTLRQKGIKRERQFTVERGNVGIQ